MPATRRSSITVNLSSFDVDEQRRALERLEQESADRQLALQLQQEDREADAQRAHQLRNGPARHDDSPVLLRDASANRRDVFSQRRGASALHHDSPVRDVSAQRQDSPAQRRDAPSQRRGTSGQHRGSPARGRDAHAQLRDSAVRRRRRRRSENTVTHHGSPPPPIHATVVRNRSTRGMSRTIVRGRMVPEDPDHASTRYNLMTPSIISPESSGEEESGSDGEVSTSESDASSFDSSAGNHIHDTTEPGSSSSLSPEPPTRAIEAIRSFIRNDGLMYTREYEPNTSESGQSTSATAANACSTPPRMGTPNSTWGDCTICFESPITPQGCNGCHQILGCKTCVQNWFQASERPSCPLCRRKWHRKPDVALMTTIERRRRIRDRNRMATRSGDNLVN